MYSKKLLEPYVRPDVKAFRFSAEAIVCTSQSWEDSPSGREDLDEETFIW